MAKTKWSEIKEAALHLALNRDTYYCNKFPYNCLYYTLKDGFGCDCIGLIKSLINRPNQAYTSNDQSYVIPGIVVPDWTENQLIDHCPDKSSDFHNLQEGEILMTCIDGKGEEYGHGGWFVGEFVDPHYGCIVNTIECTTCYEYDGIMTTYTDENGDHWTSKGGRYIGHWEYHGHLVDYIEFDNSAIKWTIEDWIAELKGSMAEFSAISLVFDTDFYYNTYPDLQKAFGKKPTDLLNHFFRYGMKEGRQGCEKFNVEKYKENYKDLQNAFGDDWVSYYIHYIKYGWAEGRNA